MHKRKARPGAPAFCSTVRLTVPGSTKGADDDNEEDWSKLTDKDLSALPIVNLQVSSVVLFVLWDASDAVSSA